MRTGLRNSKLRGIAAVAAASLTACGAPSSLVSAPEASAFTESVLHHQTFQYTGKPQAFTVPAGVRQITIVALGGRGAGQYGGLGGRVYAIVPVAPEEKLAVYVGGEGSTSGVAGFDGGGAGGGPGSGYSGNGGGGASDVRAGGDKLIDRVLVVGGGGGQGGTGNDGSQGGNGGGGGAGIGGFGLFGTSYASGGGGGGGRQHRGGRGGIPGANGLYGQRGRPGSLGSGGNGGHGAGYHYGVAGGGAGAGGGYYGGGGGGGGGSDSFVGGSGGGGGGGSSYVEPSALSHREWRGWKEANGNGVIVISWS